MTRAADNEFIKFFYSIVVSLCWIHKRPVKVADIEALIDLSQKRIRRALDRLERETRIAKIVQRNDVSGRPCVAWVVADRDELPKEIRNVCHNCGDRGPTEIHRDRQLCEACLVAVENGESRQQLTPTDEEELSMFYTIIATNHNEHSLG